MRIREAEQSDGDQLWKVHAAAIRELCADRYSPAEIEAWAGQLGSNSYARSIEERELFVAVDSQAIVGFGQLNASTGEIDAVYVHPSAVRRGIGSELLLTLERTVRAGGLREVFLDSSLNAVGFYAAVGYRSESQRVHRLRSGVDIACVRMSKHLADEGGAG